jgi:uncharacterized protein YcbK (DUF882 family)
MTPNWTETAVANGETRTLHLVHAHTQEAIDATYLVNGRYDQAVLQQLNWFLRDWRRDEPTNMDPRLFDVIWQAYNEAGVGEQVVKVMSAYRSPETNAMLRSRSRAVAKYSQHMLGKAMDTSMPGLPMSRIREVGMRLQRGGVGYYPTAGTPFVHLDVGSVRAWPRMNYDQLARLFPDGKTVHIPSNGQPMARYEEAKAEIEARNNGAIVVAPKRSFGGLFAFLFGGGGGEDEAEDAAPPAQSDNKKWAKLAPRMGRDAKRVAALEADEEGGAEAPLPPTAKRISVQQARALSDLPRGETAMSAPGAAAPPPSPPPASTETSRVRYASPEQEPERSAALGPAAPEKPTPIDAVRDEEPKPRSAARTRQEKQEVGAAKDDESETPKAAAPTPPRRPSTLAAVAPVPSSLVSAPTPPSRPKELAVHGDSKSVTTLFETTGSIDPKAHGKRHGKGADALAYAPTQGDAKSGKTQAAPTPPTRPTTLGVSTPARDSKGGLAPARLDRGNFLSMTGGPSVLGKSVGDLRSATQKKAKGADKDDDDK